MSNPEIRVSAGVFKSGSKVLVCRRSESGLAPGAWQFPGGKARPHEQPIEALVREIDEELCVRVKTVRLLAVERYVFSDALETLVYFYLIENFEGEITDAENQNLCWKEIGSLREENLLESNRNVVEIIERDSSLVLEHFIWDDVWETDSREFSRPDTRQSRAVTKLSVLGQMGFVTNDCDRIADLGCGSGEVSLLIHKNFLGSRVELFCIDKSERALNRLRALGTHSNLFLIKGEVTKIPVPPGYFDTVVALGVAEHLDEPRTLLKEVNRTLKIGGELFISFSNTYSIFYPLRLIRQALGCWPYGYQQNLTPRRFRALISEFFLFKDLKVVLPGSETPNCLWIDMALNSLFGRWGRTLFIKARKEMEI